VSDEPRASARSGSRSPANLRRFIGVDLGGGRGKNTAVARLEHLEKDGSWRLVLADAKSRHGQRGTGAANEAPEGDAYFRDEVLVDYIERWTDDATVVAIDAPLTLPPCLRCGLPCPGIAACEVPVVQWMRNHAPKLRGRGRSDPGKPSVTPYTQRATELLLAGTGLRPREAMGQGTGPLAARAAWLRRRLSPILRLHENLIEVHPPATLARLFGAERARRAHQGEQSRVWEERKAVLHALGHELAFAYVWPELVVRSVHVFHAVLCAFTAYLWAAGRAAGPTELAPGVADDAAVRDAGESLGELWLDDGWIWVPRRGAAG
jgi:predicted nuclease with RNAse H fold